MRNFFVFTLESSRQAYYEIHVGGTVFTVFYSLLLDIEFQSIWPMDNNWEHIIYSACHGGTIAQPATTFPLNRVRIHHHSSIFRFHSVQVELFLFAFLLVL